MNNLSSELLENVASCMEKKLLILVVKCFMTRVFYYYVLPYEYFITITFFRKREGTFLSPRGYNIVPFLYLGSLILAVVTTGKKNRESKKKNCNTEPVPSSIRSRHTTFDLPSSLVSWVCACRVWICINQSSNIQCEHMTAADNV